MTEEPLDEMERHRAELYARLAGTGDFRPGSVSETWRRCGKPNCACARPDHRGHGPRYLWTRSAGGRTRSRQLPGACPAARRAGPQVPRPVTGMTRLRAGAVRLAAAPPGLVDAARTEVAGPGQLLIQLRTAAFQLVELLCGHPGSPLEVCTLPDYRANLHSPRIPTFVSHTPVTRQDAEMSVA